MGAVQMTREDVENMRQQWETERNAAFAAAYAKSDETGLCLSYEEAFSLTRRWCDSYSRLETAFELTDHMTPREWWRLLGENWSLCDNVAEHSGALELAWSGTRASWRRLMMNHDEHDAWAALPSTLTVYRGCYGVNRKGWSWSLDRDIAASFPTLNRYRRDDDKPLLLTGRIRAASVILKLDREEQEIVARPGTVRVVKEEEISAPTAT